MQIREVTFTQKYKWFDKGEKVKPTSPRCSLPPGNYIVTKCIPPRCPGDNSIVFVEGRQAGVDTEYLTSDD